MEIDVLSASDEATINELAELLGHLSPKVAGSVLIDVRATLDSGCAKILVARDSVGHIVGTITLFVFDAFSGRHGWLEDLVVAPAMRGRGLGAALMKEAIELARRDRVGKLLSCSHPRREAANRVHVAVGFETSESNLYRIRLNQT